MHKMVVLAKAAAGRLEELGHWFDTRHFPDMLAVDGFVSAERHTLLPVKQPEGMMQWDFMLVYEIAADDPMAVLRTMGGLLGTERMPQSDALESSQTLSLMGLSQYRQQR